MVKGGVPRGNSCGGCARPRLEGRPAFCIFVALPPSPVGRSPQPASTCPCPLTLPTQLVLRNAMLDVDFVCCQSRPIRLGCSAPGLEPSAQSDGRSC